MTKKNGKKKFIKGKVEKNSRGYAFVTPEGEEPKNKDIFVSPNNIGTAMSGDIVEVELIPKDFTDGKEEGIITKIVKRDVSQVIGTLETFEGFGFVISDDKKMQDDIFVKRKNFGKAKNGDKVIATIVKYPTKKDNAEGIITEVIAKAGDERGEVKAILKSKGIKEEFSKEVLEEAEKVAKENISKAKQNREIIDGKTVITIDGKDSKDLDDAISVELLSNGNFLLGVHIADVSHYVKKGSLLDEEALKRGNSIYLLDTVVPMLPRILSNGACSLNPNEEKLTLTCEMEIDYDGNVVNHRIFESVIKSDYRMVYDDVSDILENNDEELIEKYKDIHKDLINMERLGKILREKRDYEGSIDFNVSQAKVILDKKGRAVDIELEKRRIANRLIEEFMLIANKNVAEHFFWLDAPFLYRVHEKPEVDRIKELKAFLGSFYISLSGNPEHIHPKMLNDILNLVDGKPYENIVSTVILRSMQKAYYSPSCIGHFGLAFKYYTHFTSPIRRYPDLLIHRIIKEYINGNISKENIDIFSKDVEKAAPECSVTEKDAEGMERQIEKMKKAQYMEEHIGEKYTGHISGVTDFGIFVELENTVEGLIPLRTMNDDFYIFEPEKYRIIGEKKKKIYALGDKLKIKVIKASAKDAQVDFEIVK